MRRGAAIALGCAALVVACGGGGSDPAPGPTADGTPVAGGTLVVGLATETTGFNAAADQWGLSGYQIAQAVFDRLMAYDEHGDLRPYLAESMVPDADFLTWTIRLRPDVRFHDGTPLDAVAMHRNLTEHVESPILGQVFRAVDSIEVVDDRTVAVHMNSPWSSFPHTLTAQPGYVMAPAMFDDPGGSRNPIGTGPFHFVEWIPDSTFTVERNDDYWRPGFPLLDAVEFRILVDGTSRRQSLESGGLHVMEIRDAGDIADLEADDGDDFAVHLDDEGETTEEVFFLNAGAPPFDDATARRAVALAIDRVAISEVVYGGRFPPANGPFKPGSPWYRDVDFPTHDAAGARAALAGYETAHGAPLAFEIVLTTSPEAVELAQLLQSQFEAVGMEVTLTTLEATAALAQVLTGQYDASMVNVLWGSRHPDREYTFIHSSNAGPVGALSTNYTRIVDATVDAGLDGARTVGDLDAQADEWARVQQGLADSDVFHFLVHDDVGAASHRDVRDLTAWTFPDGARGLPIEQTLLSLYQVWLAS